ncbi:MAG: aminotransferase class I/II-fold pyridoxal phosphate-dependent enzyme [Acidobacteria bacterium]|nr:aminotransferase class I/II-fold pyridoxal phosphate-dependent enzyme [Acidobacteriota bacterium]
MKHHLSRKVLRFTKSIIRDMSRQAADYGAVNLSQGFPDFPATAEIKSAARAAIDADFNQYSVTWGSKRLRDAIAEKTKWNLGLEFDPEREIVVTVGSTEAMIATLLAIVNPGDEVIVFEPFFENYNPDTILTEATIRHVTLHAPDWHFDRDELCAKFNEKTKAIIINTPHNPTGKVYSREELRFIADLCIAHDALALTDEIYEHIWYPDPVRGIEHVAMATLDGMRDRTVTINSMSKTYEVTGWRVGFALAHPELIDGIRQVHDFLSVCASSPLQEACVTALGMPRGYYLNLQTAYQRRRDFLMGALEESGFRCYKPDGAYYIMADITEFGFDDDFEFAEYLIREIGVAVVPGSSFYRHPELGAQLVRFCFCKRDETLKAAADRLQRLKIK